MKQTEALTPDEIRQAVAMIQRIRPSYKEILDFYGKVAVAQMASTHRIDPGLIDLPEGPWEVNRKEGFPLLAVSQFIIDGEASGALLIELCKIAMQANPVMAESAERIEKAVKRGDVTVPLLFEALAADDKAPLEKSARDMNADAGVLSFLTYNSVAPSILRCVAHLATVIPQDAVWTANGVCPVCGSAPGMATLEKEGKRFLTCHFCRYAWNVPRTLCPFCGNEDQKEMKYFYSDEEPEYRVNTCDHCQTYLKTVDTRKLDRILYLPLEQAATLHLDLMAQEKGYRQPAFFV